MPEPFGYSYAQVSLWAVIAGTELPVVRFVSDFEINAIPRATVVIALGRDAGRTQAASPIHSILDRLTVRQPVQVYASFTGRASAIPPAMTVEDPKLPLGPFLVFEGYTTGFGDQRSTTSANYTLELVHWLVDLASSSALSAAAQPSIPADLAFPNALRVFTPDTVAGRTAGGGLCGTSLSSLVIRADTVDDLWGNGILPWFRLLASTDHLADGATGGEFGRLFGTKTAGPNAAALAALDRMVPKTKKMPPLKFRTLPDGALADAIARNIKDEIVQTSFDSLLGQTLWDHLVTMSASYLFAIVPCISTALVVPWLPTLRTPWSICRAADVTERSLAGDMPQLIRGVALTAGKSYDAGAALPADRAGDPPGGVYRTLGVGAYLNGDKGVVIIREAPTWLAGVPVQVYMNPIETIDQVRNTPAAPTAGPTSTRPTPGDDLSRMSPSLTAFARTLYGLEVLKFRTGTVYGKFRCDLCPGSIVQVDGAGEKFLAAADQLGRPVFAAISRVSQGIDAESRQAWTAFGLAHVRTEAENKADATSLAEHPLYADTWPGADLVG